MAQVLGAAIVCLISISPVLFDLLATWQDSSRWDADNSVFAAHISNLGGLEDFLKFVTLILVPEIIGNPISPEYPFDYDGISLTLPMAFLLIVGCKLAWPAVWGWVAAIAVVMSFSISPTMYMFGVEHLGFNLSRSTPLGTIILPVVVVVTWGAHCLCVEGNTGRVRAAVLIGSAVIFLIICGLVAYWIHRAIPIRWTVFLVMVSLCGLLALQRLRPRQHWLALCLIVSVALSTSPLFLTRNPLQLHDRSPLLDKIEQILLDGGALQSLSKYGGYPPKFQFLFTILDHTFLQQLVLEALSETDHRSRWKCNHFRATE